MKSLLIYTTLALAVSCPLWRVQAANAPDDPARPPPKFDPPLPLEPKKDTVHIPYEGTVTGVTKTSITIQYPTIEWPGWEKPREFNPKEFATSLALELGQFPQSPRPRPDGTPTPTWTLRPEFMYRLTDVKVGDIVMIRYSHLGDMDICDAIKIVKRPGGRVPPLSEEAETRRKARLKPHPAIPGFPETTYIPYHEEMNAHWNLEDKGIPYPAKFGERRRWPVAPMPREVKK